MHMLVFSILFLLGCHQSFAKTTLIADGTTDTYILIRNVLGGGTSQPEVPDCNHTVEHIYQDFDNELNRSVFHFAVHRDLDDDRCIHFDRQRVEVLTNKNSLNGVDGDKLSYSWNMKLDAHFQPSTGFTHVHQLKSYGNGNGSSGNPLIAFTLRKKEPQNVLELTHESDNGVRVTLQEIPLDLLLGQWIHFVEDFTYGIVGSYSLKLTRISDGGDVFSFNNNTIDLWRVGADTYYRGKWGIYRSILDIESLRDEVVLFDSVCMAKGDEECA